MDGKANVRDIDSLLRAKAMFANVRAALVQSMSEAVSHAESVSVWVERTGPARWESERRRAAEEVAAAEQALARKGMSAALERRQLSMVDERRTLAKARARMDAADEALRRLRSLRAEVSREILCLKQGLAPLSAWIDRDAVAAQATITRMTEALARYQASEVDIDRAAKPEAAASAAREGECHGPEASP